MSTLINAQNKVMGVVRDAVDESPLQYATISFYSPDSLFLSGTVSGKDGHFIVDQQATISCQIQVSMVGYKTLRSNITASNSAALTFFLEPDITQLNEILIEAKRKAIANTVEQMIVDVGAYMPIAGKNAIDVLRVLPGVMIDKDAINLMGKMAVVFIDGRPANISGAELTNYLSSLRGDQIDKVELIENPSARYDAGYNGAIINIKLKKDASLGLNGSIGLDVGGLDGNANVTPDLNFNYRTKKINIYGSYSYTYNDYINILDYNRKYNYAKAPVQYDEHSKLNGITHYHAYHVGMDYFLSNRHLVGVMLKGTSNHSNVPNQTKTLIHDIGSTTIDSIINSPIKTNSNIYNNQVNLNYKWTIDSIGTVLNADINYMHLYNKDDQFIPKQYFYTDGTTMRTEDGNGLSVKQKMSLWTAKIDFQSRFWHDGQLQIGVKYDGIDRSNNLYAFINNDGTWSENEIQSNYFNYEECISAAYISANKTIWDFHLNVGVRGEYTHQKGDQLTTGQKFVKSYSGLFPSLSAQYNLNAEKKRLLIFSYSRKILRPTFSMLNPFKLYTSPQTYQEGNPNLSPNNYNSYSLRYTEGQSVFTFQYLADKNRFVHVGVQNDDTKELGYYFINFGTNRRYRLSAYIPIHLFSWWSINANGSISYNNMQSLLNEDEFVKKYWYINGSINSNFLIHEGLTVQLSANGDSDRWYTALKIKSSGYLTASIQQTLWRKKATIALSVNDPFRWNTFHSSYQFQNIDEKTREINNARSITINFRYNFGSEKIKSNRSRNTGVEDVQNRMN